MADCERFEIAIGKRRHGALAPDEGAALAAHLSGCASCAASDRLGQTLDERMRSMTADTLQETDWVRIERRFEIWRRSHDPSRVRVVLGALAGIVGGIATLLLLGHDLVAEPRLLVTGIAVPLVFVFALQRWARLRGLREARAAEASRGALLACFREQLDRRIAQEARARTFLPVLFGSLFVLCVVSGEDARFLARFGGFVVIMFGVALHSHLRVLPRLRRERAELD
jgi:hypothetical protein